MIITFRDINFLFWIPFIRTLCMSTAAVLLGTETKTLTQNGTLVYYMNYLKKNTRPA
jgi:hypothetical protein